MKTWGKERPRESADARLPCELLLLVLCPSAHIRCSLLWNGSSQR